MQSILSYLLLIHSFIQSIWNTPISLDAEFVDVGLQSFATGQFHADTNYVVAHAKSTEAVEVINQGWWGPTPARAAVQCPQANESNTWCHCVIIGNASGTKLSVPYNWTTADGPKGVLSAGNNGATIMINSTHALQMQVRAIFWACGVHSGHEKIK